MDNRGHEGGNWDWWRKFFTDIRAFGARTIAQRSQRELGLVAKGAMIRTEPKPGVYASLSELVALQHQARGFSFLPGQPVQIGRASCRERVC